jgi:hypothetical protein
MNNQYIDSHIPTFQKSDMIIALFSPTLQTADLEATTPDQFIKYATN